MSLDPPRFGLGIDAGGSATRWQVIDAAGRAHAQGEVGGFSASMFGTAQQPRLDAALAALADALRGAPRPTCVFAGLTGHDGRMPGALHAHIARALGADARALTLASDVELAWRAVFAEPGRGVLVMAGTGSIAAHLQADGTLARAGGRGSLLDDGGGGYWIAREALRAVWRREDEAPGAWQHSVLARELFARLGGADWARTRAFVAAASRGEMGALATAVAAAAQAGDADARTILDHAGRELARIARALLARCGAQPVAVAGRAADLHPAIVDAMRADLPPGTPLATPRPDAARAAARLALGLAPSA